METLTINRTSLDELADLLRYSADMFGQVAKSKKADGDPASVLSGEYYRGCEAGFKIALNLLASRTKEWEDAQED